MARNTIATTALRLRAVLEILAGEEPAAPTKISRDDVLQGALARVPLQGREAEVLASGVARGERALTTATSKLVKAGWIIKQGRAGWSITAQGRKALTEFPDTDQLIAALQDGTTNPAEDGGQPGDAEQQLRQAPTEEVVEDAVAAAAETAAPDAREAHGAHPEPHRPEPSFPQPGSVAVAGSFGTALDIPDWDPAAEQGRLTFDRSDELWKLTVDLPAGYYEFKVALDGSWTENYGRDAFRDGANIELHHDGGPVTFLYDHASHAVVTKPDTSG